MIFGQHIDIDTREDVVTLRLRFLWWAEGPVACVTTPPDVSQIREQNVCYLRF